MSALVRFKTTHQYYKARVFEQASKRHICSVCNRNDWGILVRHVAPDKKDVGICNQCLVRITLGRQITVEGKKNVQYGAHPKFGHTAGKKRGPKAKTGPKPAKMNCKCEICGKTFTETGLKMHTKTMHPVSSVEADLAVKPDEVTINPPKGYYGSEKPVEAANGS